MVGMTDIEQVREALEPCPFCGNIVILVINENTEDATAFCGQCGCEFNAYLWNARVIPDGKVLVEKAQYLMMRQQMRYLGMVLLQNGEATITEKTQRGFSDKAIKLENIMTESGGMSIRLTYLQRREEENDND